MKKNIIMLFALAAVAAPVHAIEVVWTEWILSHIDTPDYKIGDESFFYNSEAITMLIMGLYAYDSRVTTPTDWRDMDDVRILEHHYLWTVEQADAGWALVDFNPLTYGEYSITESADMGFDIGKLDYDTVNALRYVVVVSALHNDEDTAQMAMTILYMSNSMTSIPNAVTLGTVPEPSTGFLAVAGIGLLMKSRRRRSAKA